MTELVFLIIGKWDYTVLLGNLLSGCAAVLNFLLMGITVQNALSKDEKSAKTAVRPVSYTHLDVYKIQAFAQTAILNIR